MKLAGRKNDEASFFDDAEERLRLAREIREKYQSKPGTLGLPPLLDQRRWEHLIPDGAFREQAFNDRIFIYQIGRVDKGIDEGDLHKPAKRETWGNTSIEMPQQSRDYQKHETPRGILVSAGICALESFHSQGIDLGHIVGFIRNAPWAKEVEYVGAKPVHLLMMNAGDITGSEHLRANLQSGKVQYKFFEDINEYRFVDENGKQWKPKAPWVPEDFA